MRKSPVDTKVRQEEGESAPNTGVDIPLQPLEGTKVEKLFPLEMMEYPVLEQLDIF